MIRFLFLFFLFHNGNIFANEIDAVTPAIKQIILPQYHIPPTDDETISNRSLESQFQIYRKMLELVKKEERTIVVYAESAFFNLDHSNRAMTIEELKKIKSSLLEVANFNKIVDFEGVLFGVNTFDGSRLNIDIDLLDVLIKILESNITLNEDVLKVLSQLSNFSRFDISDGLYSEHHLRFLAALFPAEITSLDELTEEQRRHFANGSLPILIAQNIVEHVEKTECEAIRSEIEQNIDDFNRFKDLMFYGREKSVVNLMNSYKKIHPDHLLVLIYGDAHDFRKYFHEEETMIFGKIDLFDDGEIDDILESIRQGYLNKQFHHTRSFDLIQGSSSP